MNLYLIRAADRRAMWFAWRRRETWLQLQIRQADDDELADELYGQLVDVHDELPLLRTGWLELYEWHRSWIRVRNVQRGR